MRSQRRWSTRLRVHRRALIGGVWGEAQDKQGLVVAKKDQVRLAGDLNANQPGGETWQACPDQGRANRNPHLESCRSLAIQGYRKWDCRGAKDLYPVGGTSLVPLEAGTLGERHHGPLERFCAGVLLFVIDSCEGEGVVEMMK
jgi:hypothetical protein